MSVRLCNEIVFLWNELPKKLVKGAHAQEHMHKTCERSTCACALMHMYTYEHRHTHKHYINTKIVES